jgi:hypothetical protein
MNNNLPFIEEAPEISNRIPPVDAVGKVHHDMKHRRHFGRRKFPFHDGESLDNLQLQRFGSQLIGDIIAVCDVGGGVLNSQHSIYELVEGSRHGIGQKSLEYIVEPAFQEPFVVNGFERAGFVENRATSAKPARHFSTDSPQTCVC